MKKTLLVILTLAISLTTRAQNEADQVGTYKKPTVAGKLSKIQITGKIPELCDRKAVYSLNENFTGQEKAIPPLSRNEILQRLNNSSAFLSENSKFKGEGMVGIYINCKGKVALCQMDIPTKSELLNEDIVEAFKLLGDWKAGKANGKEVDTVEEFKIQIKKGTISFVE